MANNTIAGRRVIGSVSTINLKITDGRDKGKAYDLSHLAFTIIFVFAILTALSHLSDFFGHFIHLYKRIYNKFDQQNWNHLVHIVLQ